MNIKKILVGATMGVILLGVTTPAFAEDNTPQTTTRMGSERALLNSNGSPLAYGYQDRTHGGFGPLQADWVKSAYVDGSFGQWLKQWKLDNCDSNSVR